MTDTLEPRLGWSRWRRSWWYHAKTYAHTWRGSVASTIFFPIFYLAALGVGVGHLVSKHTGLVQGQTYLHFIAPSLLATTAMQLGEGESLWPVLAAIKWIRNYHAAVATPLEPEDIYLGKLTWVATRSLATGVIYTIVIYRFAFVPMFLFSATFYPVTAYPGYLRPLVQLVPLYHGVALARAAAFGQGAWDAILAHVAFLIVMAVIGVVWGRRSMRRRLVD